MTFFNRGENLVTNALSSSGRHTNFIPTVTRDDIKRWMDSELQMKSQDAAYALGKKQREEQLRLDDAQRVSDVFRLFDADRTGKLALADLPLVLKALGCDDVTATETELVPAADSGAGAPSFTLDDLIPTAIEALEKGRTADTKSAKDAFDRFCHKDSTKGDAIKVLDKTGLASAFAACGARASEQELEELVRFADMDNDGAIGEQDWLTVMQFVQDTQ